MNLSPKIIEHLVRVLTTNDPRIPETARGEGQEPNYRNEAILSVYAARGAVCTKRHQSACIPCWRWSGVCSLSHTHIPPMEVEDIHIHVQTCIETCIYLLSLCTVHQIQA